VLDPSLAEPLNNLAIVAFRAKKFNEAESLFRQYLKANPIDAQGWVNLGLLMLGKVTVAANDKKATDEAETDLRTALRLEPTSAAAYKALGRLCFAINRKKDALNAFQCSYSLDDEQPQVRQYIEGLADDSDDMGTRTAQKPPVNTPPAKLVWELLDQQKFTEAETACREWTKTEPTNPLAWRLLGQACKNLGHTEEARRAVERAVRFASVQQEGPSKK
jgi:Flp pilus assembly protein TadD